MDKLWSKTEISHLKRNSGKQSPEELAQRFHTDAETVRLKIAELGLMSGPDTGAADSVNLFTTGVEKLFAGELEAAASAFESVKNEAEGRQMRDRAGQYLQVCRDRLAPAATIEDPYLEAVMAKNRGELETALELCNKNGDVKGVAKYAYLAASLHSLAEQDEEALDLLARAIELEPRNRIYAYHDPDFSSLRSHDSFSELMKARASA